MRTVLIALLALPLLACGEPYRYEKRGSDLIRIHKRSGRAEILTHAYQGKMYWRPVYELKELDADRTTAQVAVPLESPTPDPDTGRIPTPRFYRPSQATAPSPFPSGR